MLSEEQRSIVMFGECSRSRVVESTRERRSEGVLGTTSMGVPRSVVDLFLSGEVESDSTRTG